MVTKKDIQIEIALRMWKAIADEPFCSIGNKKEEIGKEHNVDWKDNCLLCELYRINSEHKCDGCPLFKKYGRYDNGMSPYSKLFKLKKKHEMMIEKWKKYCFKIMKEIIRVKRKSK